MDNAKQCFDRKEQKEDFKDLCTEILPLIIGIRNTLKRRGIETMSTITIDNDGYLSFHIQESKWDMIRLGSGPVTIMYEYGKELNMVEQIGLELNSQEPVKEGGW